MSPLLRKRMCVCLSLLAAGIAFGVERAWVGPTSGGMWRTASNWDPAGTFGSDDVAVFNRAGSYEIGVEPSDSPYNFLAGIRCEKGTVRIYNTGAEGDYKNFFRLKSADAGSVCTNDFYVAGGASLVLSNSVIAHSSGRAALRKTGTGPFEWNGCGSVGDWGKIAAFVIAEGSFAIRNKTVNYPLYGRVHVLGGATFTTVGNYVYNSARLFVDEGGLYNASGGYLYLDEFSGGGIISNASTIANLKFAEGIRRFSGHVYPVPGTARVPLLFNARASTVLEQDWKVLLGASNAFSQVKLEFPSSSGSPVGFASGLGAANVYEIQFGDGSSKLTVEDEDGNPVTVRARCTNGAKLRVKGCGSFYLNNGVSIRNVNDESPDLSGLTGTFGVLGGEVSLGASWSTATDSFPELDPSLTIYNGLTLYLYALSAGVDLANDICGSGTYGFWGTLTLRNLNTTNAWWQIRDNADVTVAGGHSTVASYGLYMYAGSKMTVADGAYAGGPPRVPTYGFSGNVLKQSYGMAFNSGWSAGTIVVTNGGYLAIASPPTKLTVADGGTIEVRNNPNESAAHAWTFDGGNLFLNPADAGYNLPATPSSDGATVTVGPKGMLIRPLQKSVLRTDDCMQFYMRCPVGGAGGVTRRGTGFVDFYKPMTIAGAFENLDGTLRIPNQSAVTGATAPLFGTGDFLLGNSRIEYANGISSSFTARIGTSGRFIYDGAATVRVRESTSRPIQTLQFGTLTRKGPGAALYFLDASQKGYNSSGANVTFTSAPAVTADGRIDEPVFTYAYGNHHNDFASYSAEEGLKAFTNFTDWAQADATKTVITPKTVTHVTADTAVGALMVRGISAVYDADAPLWIDEGVTLAVGSGTAPACVILRSGGGWGQGKINGPGTLDFGAREGVILSDRIDHEYGAVNAKIAGTGGLTLTGVSLLGDNAGLWLGGANTYSGTTRIYSTKAMPKTSGAFGASTVEIGNGELQGGTLRFAVAGLSIPNRVRAAGWGYRAGATDDCAISFSRDGTLTGPVEVYDEVRFSAANGMRGMFAGPISGAKVWIWQGAGEIVFAAANTLTGGVEVVCSSLVLTDAGTAGTGAITLNNGALVLENSADKTVPNEIRGLGRIRMRGKGAVTFANLASQEGAGFTLDLTRRSATIATLDGISAITTPRSGPTALVVLDGDVSFAGEKPANVTLYRPGEYRPGGMYIIGR